MDIKTNCPYCGGLLSQKQMEGRLRAFCVQCDRPIYENPVPATCLVVVNPEGQILLVQRSAPPQVGQWCLPGGFIELDEIPENAALRELSEETGLVGEIECLLGVRSSSSTLYHSVLLIGYLIRQYTGRLIAGDDAADARWFQRSQFPPVPFESHVHFIHRYFEQFC